MKVQAKGFKLLILANAVAYAGLFLTGELLKWFKPYFLEFQENRLIITNQEVQYIFLSQDGFIDRLTQIFRDLEVLVIAKRKIQELTQRGLAMEYIT